MKHHSGTLAVSGCWGQVATCTICFVKFPHMSITFDNELCFDLHVNYRLDFKPGFSLRFSGISSSSQIEVKIQRRAVLCSLNSGTTLGELARVALSAE